MNTKMEKNYINIPSRIVHVMGPLSILWKEAEKITKLKKRTESVWCYWYCSKGNSGARKCPFYVRER